MSVQSATYVGMADMGPRETHRIKVTKKAFAATLADQARHASAPTDHDAINIGASSALFDHMVQRFKSDGTPHHQAVLKAGTVWRALPDYFSRMARQTPDGAANDKK